MHLKPIRSFVLLRHLALAVLLLVSTLVRAQERGEQGSTRQTEQTKREAGDLLRVVWRDFDVPIRPCTFDTNWSTRPVDVSLAQQYLGSKLHADLLAPDPGAAPAAVIDPARLMPASFCTDVEAERLWQQRQADFRGGLLSGDADGGRQSASVSMTRIQIAMPVFDAELNMAIVVIAAFTQTVTKTNSERAKSYPRLYDSAGYNLRPVPGGVGYSAVYRKQDAGWVRIHLSEDFWLH